MSLPSSRHSHRHVFAPGEVIFREGERGDVAYIVESGRISLTRQSSDELLHVATLGAGEIAGEMALIDDSPRTVTATAVEESGVFIIDRDLLRQHLRSADPMLRLLMRVVLDRMSRSRARGEAPPLAEDSRPDVGDAPGQGAPERRAIGQIKFEHELKRGLASGQFELMLQPIVDLSEGSTVGFEALMSWHHPTRGRLSPASFIAIAERSGLVRELDDLALRLAIRALKHLTRAGGAAGRPLRLSVNLSGAHAEDASTVERVRKLLEEEAIEAAALTLEITESWLVSDPEHAQGVLTGLKELGFRLALDDFGTGYSSLAYLHRFPIDDLKVDRSFTQNMLVNEGSRKIVRAVIALAHSLGLRAIAEGIDDAEQVEMLRDMGCELGQGYLFSRPLDVVQAEAYLARSQG